jgi:hypothetical protein
MVMNFGIRPADLIDHDERPRHRRRETHADRAWRGSDATTVGTDDQLLDDTPSATDRLTG